MRVFSLTIQRSNFTLALAARGLGPAFNAMVRLGEVRVALQRFRAA